jgi:glycosyltransferase involved in cell wall biosynthesis
MRVAFYSPLKSPEDPVPSGDREMARGLIAALRLAGHTVAVASALRSYSREPDPVALADIERRGEAEVRLLIERWRNSDGVPDLWFTYHPYYKAPDLLGPAVAAALDIPYVTAEASYAGKRDRDPWRAWQAHVAGALRRTAANFCFTPGDAAGVRSLLGSPDRIVPLPPFTDTMRFEDRAVPTPATGKVRCLTVAMMRPGVKIESYVFLAAALQRLRDLDWQLTIVGDGPARETVAETFAGLPEGRVEWRGRLSAQAVAAELMQADLFVWPGIGEAYGMVYLEAQAAGLPVVALDSGGVASTLRAGETGLLVAEGDLEAYVEAVRRLIEDTSLRQRMSLAARAFARNERSLERASVLLDAGLAAAGRYHAGKSKEFREP